MKRERERKAEKKHNDVSANSVGDTSDSRGNEESNREEPSQPQSASENAVIRMETATQVEDKLAAIKAKAKALEGALLKRQRARKTWISRI